MTLIAIVCKCGHELGVVTATEGMDHPLPSAGDYAICVGCAQVYVFAAIESGVKPRIPTMEEIRALDEKYKEELSVAKFSVLATIKCRENNLLN